MRAPPLFDRPGAILLRSKIPASLPCPATSGANFDDSRLQRTPVSEGQAHRSGINVARVLPNLMRDARRRRHNARLGSEAATHKPRVRRDCYRAGHDARVEARKDDARRQRCEGDRLVEGGGHDDVGADKNDLPNACCVQAFDDAAQSVPLTILVDAQNTIVGAGDDELFANRNAAHVVVMVAKDGDALARGDTPHARSPVAGSSDDDVAPDADILHPLDVHLLSAAGGYQVESSVMGEKNDGPELRPDDEGAFRDDGEGACVVAVGAVCGDLYAGEAVAGRRAPGRYAPVLSAGDEDVTTEGGEATEARHGNVKTVVGGVVEGEGVEANWGAAVYGRDKVGLG